MSRPVYLVVRTLVALVGLAAFLWLFLTPLSIEPENKGYVYSGCHPVGWNFNGDYRPLFDDSFDVEDYDAVREYIDQGGRKSRGPLNDDIKKGIQEACEEARHERGIVSVAVLVFFVVLFVSVPKPKFSKESAHKESRDVERQLESPGKEEKR